MTSGRRDFSFFPHVSILTSWSVSVGLADSKRRKTTQTISATAMLISVAPHVSSSIVPRHLLQRTPRVGSNCSITGSGI